MDPAGASQPPKATAYKQKGVGVDSNPEELRAAQQKSSGKSVETRFSANDALDADKAQPTPVAWGTRGALVGEEAHGGTEEEYGRHQELDGQQMCASGEGAVADVVRRKPGATGSQPDLASDLDRKKAEQAEKREAIKQDRAEGRITGDLDPRAGVQT